MVDNSAFQPETTFGPASNREPPTRHRGGKPENADGEISSRSHDTGDTSDSNEIAMENISFNETRDGDGDGEGKHGEGNSSITKGPDNAEKAVHQGSAGNEMVDLNSEKNAAVNWSEQAENAITKDPHEINRFTTDNSMADERIGYGSEWKRKIILMMCTVTLFLICSSVGIIGPFLPLVAQTKGMSQTIVGVVFGSLQVVYLLTTPPLATFMTKLGPKAIYVSAILVGGVGCVLSGPLDKTPDGAPFISTVLVCRCVQAVGFGAINIAGVAIVSNTYPNNIGTAFGVLQIGTGLGFMLGPLVGGALYEVGGYGLPFYVVGGLVLLNGLLVFKFIPPIEYTPTEQNKGSMLGLLRSPMVVVPMCSVVVATVGGGTCEATLATHMEQFELSTLVVSLFFVINPGILVIFAPLFGYISDMRDLQSPLIVGGHLSSAIGFLLLGPSELFPFIPSNPETIGVALACIGLGISCVLIPTLTCMVKGALELKYEDNLDTYAFVSGLHNTAICIGGVVGPIGLAALIDQFGHRVVYTAVGLACVAMMLVSLVFFSGRNATRKQSLELDHKNHVA